MFISARPTLFIDADGCAVKTEAYRVADRYQLAIFVVANQEMYIPQNSRTNMIVVSAGPDAADDWIVDHVIAGDIVITADILLADRCLKKQARVLGAKGIEFTENSIGEAVATRELMQQLRQVGEVRGGPAPMEKKDRSQFLGKLDQIIQSLLRK